MPPVEANVGMYGKQRHSKGICEEDANPQQRGKAASHSQGNRARGLAWVWGAAWTHRERETVVDLPQVPTDRGGITRSEILESTVSAIRAQSGTGGKADEIILGSTPEQRDPAGLPPEGTSTRRGSDGEDWVLTRPGE